jgi:hypothetical protein
MSFKTVHEIDCYFFSDMENVQTTPLKYNQSMNNLLKYFFVQFTT